MKSVIRCAVFIGSCIPYSFFAMSGDAEKGTMLFYGIMLICLAALCSAAYKFQVVGFAVAGSVISAILSYICVGAYMTEKWSWYFKPLTPTTLTLVLSLLVIVTELILWHLSKKGTKIP